MTIPNKDERKKLPSLAEDSKLSLAINSKKRTNTLGLCERLVYQVLNSFFIFILLQSCCTVSNCSEKGHQESALTRKNSREKRNKAKGNSQNPRSLLGYRLPYLGRANQEGKLRDCDIAVEIDC